VFRACQALSSWVLSVPSANETSKLAVLYGIHEKNGFLRARFVGNRRLESLFLMVHTRYPPVRVGLGSRASVSLDDEVA